MTRAVRNLDNLKLTGSTARVLNLLQIWEAHGEGDLAAAKASEWSSRPMFDTAALNRSIVVKHRVRRNEANMFGVGTRRLATKVILPMSHKELRYGGQFMFVDQYGFEALIAETFGLTAEHRDVRILRLMDGLPSLDPFLLREQLRRHGFDPAPCYFSISPGDLERMHAFVQTEITPLVSLSRGDDMVAEARISARVMAAKILSDSSGDQLDALRQTLRLAPDQYQEGVFCWKGFLYYKWSLETLMADVWRVSEALQHRKPLGRPGRAEQVALDRSRSLLRAEIHKTCESVRKTLAVYDDAYASLQRGRPTDFRDFLLAAPRLFSRLGEELGVVQHIVSFWSYRFGPRSPAPTVEELMDIFAEFEVGLTGDGVARDAA